MGMRGETWVTGRGELPWEDPEDVGVIKPIDERFDVDVDLYSFFDQKWLDFSPKVVTESVRVPSHPDMGLVFEDKDFIVDPLATLEDELIVDVMSSLRIWGQGPVLASMKALDITSINDRDTADSVLNWLGDNYASIFEGYDEFEQDNSIPEVEDYTYEPVEMDLTYEPRYSSSDKIIRHAFDGKKYPLDEKFPMQELSQYYKAPQSNSLYDL